MRKCIFFILLFFIFVILIITHSEEEQKLGVEKCSKTCHKKEYNSWLKTEHSKLNPQVDCESCHGNGSRYSKLYIMKNKEEAEKLGLIIKPEENMCKGCHKNDFKQEMMKLVHP